MPVCVRAGLRALPPRGALQSSSPTRSLPSRLWIAAGGGGAEGDGETRGRGARARGAGRRRRGEQRTLTVWLVCPCAGREPSRRRGAAALPCPASLVRLGRRPQQRSPRAAHGRAAAAPAEPPPGEGAGGAGGVGVRTRAAATAAARESRSRPAAGGREPRGPRTQRRPATPRRLITFASTPGGDSCTSPPLGAGTQRGNSFPLTSSSEMQKISDFDR